MERTDLGDKDCGKVLGHIKKYSVAFLAGKNAKYHKECKC